VLGLLLALTLHVVGTPGTVVDTATRLTDVRLAYRLVIHASA
jgi:hypothetical protein